MFQTTKKPLARTLQGAFNIPTKSAISQLDLISSQLAGENTSQDSMMYALPFVLGVPAIIVWRGRALPPEEKSYLAEKYAYLREPSSVGAFIFGVLFIVSLLWMLSSWEIYDLAGGQLSAWFLSRGIGSRPKKRKSAQMLSHSPNGISLGSVLTQVGK